MKLIYIYIPIIVFALLPYQFEGRIKPFDIYLILMMVSILKAFIEHRSELKNINREYLYVSAIVVIALLLATGFSSDFSSSLIYTIRYLIYLGFSISVFLLISSKIELQKILEFVIHTANVTAIIGLSQLFYRPEHTPGLKSVEGYASLRIFSTFGNPNFYAEYLILCIPLTIALILFSKQKIKKIYFVCSLFLLFMTLLLTYTRGSFIGLLVGIAYMVVLLAPRFFLHSLVLAVIASSFAPGFYSRLINMFNLAEGSQSFRLRIWRAALGSVSSLREWIIGAGPYTFLDRFRETVLSKPELYFGYAKYSSHNIYLMVLVEGGIILLTAWVIYFSYLIYAGIDARRIMENKELKTFSVALASGLLAVIVNGFTSSIFYHPKTMTFFFTFTGLLLVSLKLKARNNESLD